MTGPAALDQTRKISFFEGALLCVTLIVATKFCTLPSVLSAAAGSKAVWVAALLTLAELVTAFFALRTARLGGLSALPMPRGVKTVVYGIFALFFTLKLTAFSREAGTYYALSLFENAPVLPVTALLLIACAVVARKGFVAAARMAEVYAWLFLFVFLFVVIFTRSEGDLFNALGMFNPDFSGFGKGLLSGAGWFGDSAVLCFLDLKETPETPRAKRRIAFAAALFCFLMITVFFAVFISAYGDAAKMTDYVFIKLSAFKANADELGSADWPVIILWAIVTTSYLVLVLLSGKESLRGLTGKEGKILPSSLLCGAALIFSAFFLDEEGAYQNFMTKTASVFCILAATLTCILGAYSIAKEKGGKSETRD